MDFQSFKDKYEKVRVVHYPDKVIENPMVSVCVQTYQHAKYIRQCLDSILMQQANFEYEILLGEDDSSDRTREICIEYANRCANKIRLFFHHRENNIKVIGGKANGRFNFVYNLFSARGKYVALCEGDDYWIDCLKLQKQVDQLENSDFVWSTHAANVLDESTGELKRFKREIDSKEVDIKTVIASGGGFFHTASLLYRRSTLEELPDFFFQIRSGDWALILLLTLYGKGVQLEDVMSVYRIHSGGVMSSVKQNEIERIKILKSNLLLVNKFNKYSNFRYLMPVVLKSLSVYKKILERFIRYILG